MSKITYEDKVALNQNPNIPDINKVNDTDMNMIKNVVNNNETKVLLAVSNSAPATCDTGDIYFNITDNLIYTATATNTWSSTGVAPTENTIYIEFTSQTAYAYDGTTLVSVGGGSSAGGGETLKIGTILPFSGGTLPTGYLFCDGSAISRTEYAGLFNVIGTSFGAGDGSTTFNLPNLKGKVPVGLDSSDSDFDAIGETGGEKTHTLTQSELPNYNLKGLKWASSGGAITLDSGSHTPGYNLNYGYNGVNEEQIDSIIINSGGSNTPHNILQPYVVVNYIIKASQTTPVQAQVVDSLSSDSTTDAPSVHIVKDKFENMYKTASMTLEAGTTMQSGYTNKISLIGEHLVSISTRFQKQASAANAYTKLATIPEGYRPTTQVLFSYVNENSTILFCYIDAGGGLYAYVSDTSKTSYSIVVSYTI